MVGYGGIWWDMVGYCGKPDWDALANVRDGYRLDEPVCWKIQTETELCPCPSSRRGDIVDEPFPPPI